MKRAVAWLGTSFTALSLLLLVGVVVLWASSYRTARFAGWSRPVPWYGALSMSGEIRLERGDYAADRAGWSCVSYPVPPGDGLGLRGEIAARGPGGGLPRRLGFALARIDYGPAGMVRRSVYLPHWSLSLPFAILPALRLRTTLRRRRPPAGKCPACGYDLTGNASGKCPECGLDVNAGKHGPLGFDITTGRPRPAAGR